MSGVKKMDKMKGLFVTGPGEGCVRMGDIPKPANGQALIKMEYAGICGGDPAIFAHNNYGGTKEKPRVSGHEFYGEVVAINNPDGRPCRVKVGDKVVGSQDAPCGICDQCLAGRPSICSGQYGARVRPSGCFAEYFERDIDRLFPVNPQIDPVVATIAEPLAVAVFDVRFTGVGMGDNVLIIGAGAVGILIGLLARQNGASKVVFAELSEHRLELMRSMGFETLHSIKDDVPAKMREMTNGVGADYVFETSGSQPGWNTSLEAVKYGGIVVPVGLPYVDREIDFGKVYEKEIDLLSVNMHQVGDFSKAVDIINSGVLNEEFRKLITSIWPLDQTIEALNASIDKAGKDIKILIKPGLTEKIVLY